MMYRRYTVIVISLLLALCSLAANANTEEPDIIPEPELPAIFKDLSPRDFRAADPVDPEPELVGAELSDSEGEPVDGLEASWGDRCPEGFDPTNDGRCLKVLIEPKVDACPDGFDLIFENSESRCEKVEVVEAAKLCPSGYFLSDDESQCDEGSGDPATPYCEAGWSLSSDQQNCERIITAEGTSSCPSGYSYSTSRDACVKYVYREARYWEVEMDCPYGYNLSSRTDADGNRTYKCTNSEPSPRYCPSGYRPNRQYEGGARGRCVQSKGWIEPPQTWEDYTASNCAYTYTGNQQNAIVGAGYPECVVVGAPIVCTDPDAQLVGDNCRVYTYATPRPRSNCSQNLGISGSYPGPYYCFGYAERAGTVDCPDGYTYAGGGTCEKTEATEVNYSCPEGEILFEGQCWTKVKTYKSADFTCQSPYSKSGNSCTRTVTTSPTMSCPSGYSSSGSSCKKTSYTSIYNKCPSGFYSSGGLCKRSATNGSCSIGTLVGSSCITTGTAACPSGYTRTSNVSGSQCSKTSYTSKVANCPSGYYYSSYSNTCRDTRYGSKDYYCESGWNLQSTQCWQFANIEVTYECPSNWDNNGENCENIVIDQPELECPEGYEDTGVECRLLEELDAEQSNLLTVTFPKVWPGSYTLDLSVKNNEGRVTERSFEFMYKPKTGGLHTGESRLAVPAVQYPFRWQDGSATLVTEPIVLDEGLLTENRPVFVGVRETAQSGFNVAGVDIAPGEFKEVASNYDFNSTKGVLELGLYPLSTEVSTSELIISVGDDNDYASLVNVDAWVFDGTVESDKDNPTQIFDAIRISAEMQGGTPCRVTGQERTARQKSALSDPYCLIEWADVPAGMAENNEPPTIVGRANYEGQKELAYEAFLVSEDGTKHSIGSAQGSIDVVKAFGAFEFAFSDDLEDVPHTITEVNTGLNQIQGPSCSLTVNEDLAVEYAQSGYVGRLCYVEWYDLPGTLEQSPEMSAPYLRGRVFSAGTYDLGVKVYGYTSLGVPVLIADQRLSFEAVDPPKPTVEFMDGNEIVEGLYEGYLDNGRIASALVKGENADIQLTHSVNGGVLEDRTFEATIWSRSFATYQRVNSIADQLWQRDTHEVKALYTDMPSLVGIDTIESLAVPGEDIGPILFTDADYVLNDDVVNFSVRMGNVYQPDIPYDPSVMGEWQVRIVTQKTYDTYEPLTEWKDHDDRGEVDLQIDIAELGVTEGYERLYAQARVKSPVPEYSRIEKSTRGVFLTILFGGEIDANIEGRRISGPVPFRGVFKLDLNDRNLFRAIGDVVWKMSSDGGETWVEKDNNARNMQYFDITLEEPGKHLLKAELKNRNSGVATETPEIEVIAYRKPEVEVEWLNDVFIGEEVTLDAKIQLAGEPVSAADVDIEWSNDGGQTWQPGGLQHVFERTTDPEEPRRERWAVRVKTPIAPADDPQAWTVEDGSISYRGIRGPRLYILGPRVTEVGKPYEFTVYKGLPYSRMEYEIEGYFTLPDGTEVPGDKVIYTPSEEELEEGYVRMTYTGWVKGWKDKGAINTDDHAMRVWQYKFPEFTIYGRYSASVAPVEATLYARPIGLSGRLEDPEYEWDIPEGVQVVEDVNPIARKLIFPEKGNYEISVKVTDRRGNEGGVTEEIEIGEPDPYELTMRVVGSNEYNRAPFEILARPDVGGGHPRDKVVEYNYTVDGEPMELVGRYGQTVLDEGEHTIRLDILSEFGLTGSVEETVTVYKNQPPACELEVYEGTFRYTISNRCDDPDGYVSDYEWWLNGEPLVLTGYRISIPKEETGDQLRIESIGIDDSGLKSQTVETTVTMPSPPPPEPANLEEGGEATAE